MDESLRHMIVNGLAGCEVAEIISNAERLWVEVVGEKAAYLRTENDDVILLSKKLYTPYTIAFQDQWNFLRDKLYNSMAVRFTEPFIVFGNGHKALLKNDANSAKVDFSCIPDEENLRLIYSAYNILFSSTDMDKLLQRGIKAVRTGVVEKVLPTLQELVGRGPGYTPAGDDFVSGVLLGFRMLNICVDAGPIIRYASTVSSWPSWKMIEHAHHGCTFLPLYNLCRSILSNKDGLEHLVDAIRIGGTTGLATLSGLLETLMFFHSNLSKISFISRSISAGGDHCISTTSTP
ncbi:MAG: DUF2877 domain-containing protein [Candidatus Caldarchaeum sp.]